MDLALFLAGDAMITQPWSQVRDPAFERLVAEMRGADVSIVNLETVIHEFDGHPQADSGGVYMSAPPAIAAELKWAGVDMVAHANNHAFDYGSIGLLATLQHAEAAGLLLAGAGPDLQRARAPRYFACNGADVGLVAMTASYVGYGRASRSRSDLHGRPGVNPLELTRSKLVEVSPRMASWLRRIARLRGKPASAVSGTSFRLFGRRFQVAERSRRVSGRRATAADAAANLDAVSESAGQADLTVASIHAHLQGSWLRKYSHALLAAGADVVFCHGPHACRGIELVGGRPIFYGLGDFVFQVEGITRFPSEAYEKLGLGDQATPADLLRASRQPGAPMAERESYEGCAALLRFRKGALAELRLLPLDLQFDAAGEGRGRPRWADPGLGRRIIERIAGQSRRHGTQIRFDPDRCEGRVELPSDPPAPQAKRAASRRRAKAEARAMPAP